jgi:hypothetical protein
MFGQPNIEGRRVERMMRAWVWAGVLSVWAVGCAGEVEFTNPAALEQEEDVEGEPDVEDDVEGDVPNNPDTPNNPDVPNPDVPNPDVPNPDVPNNPDLPDPGDLPNDPQPDVPVDPALSEAGMLTVALPAMRLQGCTGAVCHIDTNPFGNTTFLPYPTPDGNADQVAQDLTLFTAVVNFGAPASSVLLVRSQDNHNGVKLTPEQHCAVFAWIDQADGNADQVCTPP